jgi:UDP-N-acetylglucosamine diphosphorylase/glucosamine-1-phosphate N-acetyltransferase
MNIILHDLDNHLSFAPLSLTRPVGNLRMGLWTNDERWKQYMEGAEVSFATEDYLSEKFSCIKTGDNFWINATVIPNQSVADAVCELNQGEALYINEVFVALRSVDFEHEHPLRKEDQMDDFIQISERWHIYQKNEEVICLDFELVKKERESFICSETNTVIGPKENLFIDEGAMLEGATINVSTGPVYIGKNAEVMEGTVIRGPLALGDNAVLKLATKVYGATSIGTFCKVGGEVNNVVFQSYSNKGHDGFLGNSVVGEWCNIGADTNSSNLKNNYGNVKAYNFKSATVEQTDVQFMGLFMGDHSKTGINTMLNTATVIGVSSTIFSAGFPPKYIPHFSWGGNEDSPVYKMDSAIEASNNMMKRRGFKITDGDLRIFRTLHPDDKN